MTYPGSPEPQRPPIIPATPQYAPSTFVQPLPPKKRTVRTVLLLIVGAMFFTCFGGIIGVAIGSSDSKPKAQAQQTYFPDCPFAAGGCPSSAAPNQVKASSVAPSPTPSKSPVPPPPPPPPSIEDGTWTVGVDIPAGAYRVTSNVPTDCYWAIFKTGSNGQIIKNDIPGGGRPQVTLSVGQDFKTQDCGTWHKVG